MLARTPLGVCRHAAKRFSSSAMSEAKPRTRVTLNFCTAAAVGGATCFAAVSYRDGLAITLARIDSRMRPVLAAVLPHEVFVWVYSASRNAYLSLLSRGIGGEVTEFPAPCSAIGLQFRGDLGNAAGLDKEGLLLDFNYEIGAGFAVVGTVLNAPHTGNVFSMLGGLWKCNAWTPLPQSGGALNSLGLPSHGIEVPLRNIEEFRRRRDLKPQAKGDDIPLQKRFPIGVSIMGHPAQEGQQKLDGVLECVRKSIPVADFIEINESCPNVKHGGATDELGARLSAVTKLRDEMTVSLCRRVPILVKLGDVGDASATVKLLAKHGIDGIVAVNTQKDYESFDLPQGDRKLLEYYTKNHAGGLSGPPIQKRSLEQAAAVVDAVRALKLEGRFLVIHVGGLAIAEDVRSSRNTGAQLRQWYTGFMGALADGNCSPQEVYPHFTAIATS